jgi:hypothetical protein
VLKDVEIRKQPLNSLKIILPRLTFERDLEIIGPKLVPAPALEATLGLKPPFKIGRPIQGTLVLKNVGKEPILIPTTDGQYSPEARLMQVYVHIEGYHAFYDKNYVCEPSKNCKELGPGKAISFPISIYNREGYDEGKRVVQTYQRRGDNKLKVGVVFSLSGGGDEKAVPTVTEPVTQELTVFVQP